MQPETSIPVPAEPEAVYVKRAERMLRRGLGVRATAEEREEARQKQQHRTAVEEVTTRRDMPATGPARRVGVLESHLPGGAPGRRRYVEPPRERPVLAEVDVLVVGGGPGGLAAAVAAARAGADTMIVERYGCFGGVITTVGMETIAWYRYEGTTDSEGVGVEMERLAASLGGTRKWAYNDSECLDAEYFKLVADKLIADNGIKPLLHTGVVETIMGADGSTIEGVIVESKSGRQVVWAKRVIDATGDADVAFLAGARCRKTPKEDAMGVTMVFNASGVDTEKFKKYVAGQGSATYADWSKAWPQKTAGKENHLPSPYMEDQFSKAQQEGAIPKELGHGVTLGGSWSSLSEAGEATNLNLVHLDGLDPLDVRDLTKAEIEGRKQTMHALAALRHTVPGFEKSKLRNLAMTIGIRDTRKILGRYNLTGKDVLGQGRFPDSIGIFPEFVDGYAILVLPTTGRYFQVPYGCLQSPDVDNLLVAGRCVAGDKTSHAAMRNIMACTVTGQGAGVAAAVSCKLGVPTSAVPIERVQEELRRQRVRIQ
eukprot:TRINITY_DN47236_c0_g1_i1.p2 TRINITY_DN47236_c0_g1~~TRINITY_DN47236_c0_g1_i1.p2  ORF type:complete len:567 (+),score=227.10 TRINITY_DN47236_c0_g1_i1:79-1701(+)